MVEDKPYVILNFDAGGVRGYLSQKMAYTLMHDLGVQITDIADLIIGVSVGSLATVFNIPDENGGTKYTAFEALNLFIPTAKEIFKRSLMWDIFSLWGMIAPKFPTSNKDVLKPIYKNVKLGDLAVRTLLLGYETNNTKGVIFDSEEPTTKSLELLPILYGLTAPIAQFNPQKIDLTREQKDALKLYDASDYAVIYDGGFCEYNASVLAWAEARKELKAKGQLHRDIVVISFGCGADEGVWSYDKIKNRGGLAWLNDMNHMLMSGNENIETRTMDEIVEIQNSEPSTGKVHHFRFQPKVVGESVPEMSADWGTLERLHKIAEDYTASDEFREAVEEIKALINGKN